MKTIIHQKIPISDSGCLLLRAELIFSYHKKAQEILGDNYIVFTSPFPLQCVDGDDKVICIDCKEYSYNELIKIVKNHSKEDNR